MGERSDAVGACLGNARQNGLSTWPPMWGDAFPPTHEADRGGMSAFTWYKDDKGKTKSSLPPQREQIS